MHSSLSKLQQLYPRDEAQALLRVVVEDVCHAQWTHFVCDGPDALADALPAFQLALDRLLAGEPIQYITGRTMFCGREFALSPATLIPRPETEDLVEWILASLDATAPLRLLDIGTGSGCIAVSLAHALPQAHVTALDVSPQALEVARGNDFTHSVTFVCHDILSASKPPVTSRFDIIVSNPPYICLCESEQMHANVIEHEPHLALFVPDDDPLLFYRAIAGHGLELLRDGGCLYFEINSAYGTETVRLLAGMGYTDCALRNDRFGRTRMLRAKKT